MMDLELVEKDLNGFESLYPNSLIGRHCRALLDQVKLEFQIKDVDAALKVIKAAVKLTDSIAGWKIEQNEECRIAVGFAKDALIEAVDAFEARTEGEWIWQHT